MRRFSDTTLQYILEKTPEVCVLWIIRDKLTTDLENNCFYRAIKKSF